jgi:ribulose-phosphate 3-epimerase
MLGTESIRHLRKASPIPLDIHLMIQRPEDKLDWFDIQPGEYVSVHAESTRHLQRALAKIRSYGAHPIVALNPATPLYMVEDVLDDVDGVLLMTVNPGFAGQKLVPQTLDKITRLRTMLDEAGRSQVLIEVDGNVSFINGEKMRRAGADMFVCGSSSIFSKEGTVEENIARFRACVGD